MFWSLCCLFSSRWVFFTFLAISDTSENLMKDLDPLSGKNAHIHTTLPMVPRNTNPPEFWCMASTLWILLWVLQSLSHGKPPYCESSFWSPQNEFLGMASRGSPLKEVMRKSIWLCRSVHCLSSMLYGMRVGKKLLYSVAITWKCCSWYYIYDNPMWKLASLISMLGVAVLLTVGIVFIAPAL